MSDEPLELPPETELPEAPPPKKKAQGFAHPNFTRELRAEIARKGGIAAHAQGRAHQWNAETAREAGRKGGQATHAKRKARTP